MNKAFIFDMDGVIINSEPVWEKLEKKWLTSLLGKNKYLQLKDGMLGSTTNTIYKKAVELELTMSKKEFIKIYDELAIKVYQVSIITKGFDKLIEILLARDFKIGLVTASRSFWIDQVMTKIKNKNAFTYLLSLSEREDLKPKPYADGYLEMIKKLGSIPEKTIVLEDSNKGIAAAKASGALTICLKENLPKSYEAQGADFYMNDIKEVIKYIENYE